MAMVNWSVVAGRGRGGGSAEAGWFGEGMNRERELSGEAAVNRHMR